MLGFLAGLGYIVSAIMGYFFMVKKARPVIEEPEMLPSKGFDTKTIHLEEYNQPGDHSEQVA